MRQIWVLASANIRRDSGGAGLRASWRVGGGGVMGRQQEFIFAKNLHWPMSNYNFNIGYNLTFVYFGRQLVAVKIKQGIFLAVSQDHIKHLITGPEEKLYS